MELQEMKDRWAEYDRKLDVSLRLNTALLRESRLRKVAVFLWIELLVDVIAVLAIGSFLGDHFREVKFLAPALALHAFFIAMIGMTVYQLVALRSIDYDTPIVAIQKKLEQLRITRIRATKWIFIAAPLLWTPLLIVALKGFLGVDAYRIFDTPWIVANVAFGVAFLVLMLWASRHWADRLKGSPLMQRLMDDIAGRSLTSARTFVSELSRFETE